MFSTQMTILLGNLNFFLHLCRFKVLILAICYIFYNTNITLRSIFVKNMLTLELEEPGTWRQRICIANFVYYLLTFCHCSNFRKFEPKVSMLGWHEGYPNSGQYFVCVLASVIFSFILGSVTMSLSTTCFTKYFWNFELCINVAGTHFWVLWNITALRALLTGVILLTAL